MCECRKRKKGFAKQLKLTRSHEHWQVIKSNYLWRKGYNNTMCECSNLLTKTAVTLDVNSQYNHLRLHVIIKIKATWSISKVSVLRRQDLLAKTFKLNVHQRPRPHLWTRWRQEPKLKPWMNTVKTSTALDKVSKQEPTMESTPQMCFSENERNIYTRKSRLGGANLKCGRAECLFCFQQKRVHLSVSLYGN